MEESCETVYVGGYHGGTTTSGRLSGGVYPTGEQQVRPIEFPHTSHFLNCYLNSNSHGRRERRVTMLLGTDRKLTIM